MGDARYFSEPTFRFLEDLKANNDREWFAGNKHRYEEHLKAPALRLIEDFAPALERISPHFSATPRSLFRIHRDTRFSKDKSPYKTYTGIHFRHQRAGDVHAPGFYFHLEPQNVFAALGIWHPAADMLRRIRERIVEDPTAWTRATRGGEFTETFELAGERLKRPPRGFDAEHPLVEDLKWKDVVAVRQLSRTFAAGPRLPQELADLYAAGTGFMRFLCAALDAPF